MRPPDEIKHDLVRRWLNKAEEDLGVAELLFSHSQLFFAPIGFHAQQAAEKFLKALLVWHQVEFPKTHDLDLLMDLLSVHDRNTSDYLRPMAILTRYGVEVRYPAEAPEINRDQAKEAIEMAEVIRDVVLNALKN